MENTAVRHYGYKRNNAKIFSILFLILSLLLLIVACLGQDSDEATSGSCFIFGLFSLILLCVFALIYGINNSNYKYYKTVELLYVQSVKLESLGNTSPTFVGRYRTDTKYSFIVMLEIDGKTVKKSTETLFGEYTQNSLKNYLNKTVQVGYDKENDVVVVIDIL